MSILAKRIVRVCVIIGILVAIQFPLTPPNPAKGSFNRLAGSDRYQTAVAISQKGWEKSDFVVLVKGYEFANALCAGPLAIKYNAPILFIGTYSIDSNTYNEIKRLQAKTAVIICEFGAVSGTVDQTLSSAGISNIERISGSDRYETSVEIAKRLGSKEVAIATVDQYADALSIAPIAAAKGFSILLTPSDSLPAVIKQHINNYKIDRTYLIGGTEVIGKEIEKQVPSPVRLAGNDRYDTNRLIMEKFASDLDFNKIYAATGEGENGYADSLAGVVLAGKTSSPIVLNSKTLPKSTRDFILSKMTVASYIIALGGEEVVPYQVVNEYNESLNKVRKSVFNQKGNYGPTSGTSTIAGSLAVEAPDITVQNTTIEGDLLLGEGIGNGTVQLNNVTVKGRITIRGGGVDSIIGNNLTAKTAVIDVPYEGKVAFRLKGKSKVDSLTIETNCIIDDSDATTEGFKDINIIRGKDVTLKGGYNTVGVSSNGIAVAMNTATVKTYNAKSRQNITGSGTVSTANIYSNGVVFYFSPSVTNVDKGLQAYVAGQIVSEGTTKGSGTSTSTSTNSSTTTSTPITNLSASAGNEQVSLSFASPTGATSVILQQSINGGTSWTNVSSVSLTAASTSATVTGLTNGQTYHFKLVVSGGTKAGDSNIVSATPASQPISDLAGTTGSGQVTFTFSAPTGAASVVLQQSTDGGTTWSISATSVLTASSTSAVVTGLSSGQIYRFRLVVTGGSRAGNSNIINVTL
ncbi:MAG: cell wall-binding repeat-containing protein [Peptococcaceae bacterium]|nr:cell wall-binding repeat-containing protein [Peptococcaceae bacterium]